MTYKLKIIELLTMTAFTFKKYRSLILSCLLHALFVLALLYTRVHQSTPDTLFPTTRTPAKVRMQQMPLTPSHPQAPLTQALSRPMTAEPSPDSSFDEDEATERSEERSNAEPREAQDTPQAHQESSPDQTALAQEAQSGDKAILPYARSGQSGIMPTALSHRKKITPDAFMNAFSSAVRAERRRTQGNTSSSTDAYAGPKHVQERLKEWTQHHYKEKIYGALRRASNITASHMHHDKSLEKVVTIRIPINKDGSIGTMNHQHLSGIPEVDTHIIKVLQSADFPPIPDRYKTDTFLFTMNVHVSLKEGSGVYRLFV